jgi:uncharacterized protein YgiM (DUF1202 family)
MSTQTNSSLSSQSSHTVQANLEEGTWMYLDEATRATGLSEKTLRRYVQKNKLKNKRLGKQANSPLQVWITAEFLKESGDSIEAIKEPEIFDAEFDTEIQDYSPEEDCSPFQAQTKNPEHINSEHIGTQQSEKFGRTSHRSHAATSDLELVVKTLATQFADKLDKQIELTYELRKELAEKELQLRLLPDLKTRLEEQEKLAQVEIQALAQQVEALQSNTTHQAKVIEELEQENKKLKQESAAASTKTSWWDWFFGRTPN